MDEFVIIFSPILVGIAIVAAWGEWGWPWALAIEMAWQIFIIVYLKRLSGPGFDGFGWWWIAFWVIHLGTILFVILIQSLLLG